MKKNPKNEPAQATGTPEPEADNIAEFCATDLGHLQFARSLLEMQGRFSGKQLAGQSVLFLDDNASEFVLQDHEIGRPGWILETRVPCRIRARKQRWATSAIDLLQEMLKAPPPPSVANVALSAREGYPVLEDPDAPASAPWAVQGRMETPPRRAGAPQVEAPVSSAILYKLIETGAPSVALDATRGHLAQLMLELEPSRAASVSTDGHRLTLTEMGATIPAEVCGVYKLPQRAMRLVQHLVRSVPAVLLGTFKDGSWSLRAGPHYLLISPSESEFPPYRQVIPSGEDRGPRILVETRQAIAALKHFDKVRRALRESDNKGISIEVTPRQARFSWELSKQDQTVPAVDCAWFDWQEPAAVPDKGSRKKGAPAAPAAPAAPRDSLTTALSLHYFLSAVKQMGSDLTWMEFGGPLDPVVLRAADGRSGMVSGCSTFVVVMPMRT